MVIIIIIIIVIIIIIIVNLNVVPVFFAAGFNVFSRVFLSLTIDSS